jgi:hypothetical protein
MANNDRLTPVLFAWNDLLLSLLACLLVAAFLISVQKKHEADTATDRSAGNASVYVWWADNIDTDVDTYLRSPDGDRVFFAHKSGTVWSLLRDDLGLPNDLTPHNFENGFARGLPPGEYTVNVNVYRNSDVYPVAVDAELRLQTDKAGSLVTFTAHVTLDHLGDEATLWRFSIDDEGGLVPGSVHNQFVPLAKEDK